MERIIQLKRNLGLFEVTLSGIGIILGAGIYTLIGEAAGLAGNAVWISFTLSALVALLTGLSYAELASMFPLASAEYEYTSQAFGKIPAFIIGWLIILSGVIGSATVSLGFAGYFGVLTGAPLIPSALLLMVLLSAIILLGIKQSTRMAIIFTAIEALGLVLIILIGIPFYGKVNYLEFSSAGFSGIFQASALIFFAFIGFEEMVKLSEEVKDPEKNIPRGLILAISTSILLYMLVALSAVSVLGWEKLSRSSAPFADIALSAFGPDLSTIISVIALFATTNTVLLLLLASSRIIYGMAKSGSFPKIFAQVHPRTGSPWAATLLAMALAAAFIFIEDIAYVANINNFTVFITFIVINAVLITLRYRKPELARPFRAPFSVGKHPLLPVLGILFNSIMLLQLSSQVMKLGFGLILLGCFVALLNRKALHLDRED